MRRNHVFYALLVALCCSIQFCVRAQSAETPTLRRPRIALALGGGGTKAAAHLGVLRVFARKGIPVDCIAGTSIGGTIGGLYCSGMPLEKLSTLVEDAKITKAMIPPLPMIALYVIGRHIPFWNSHYAGILSGKQYKHFLERETHNAQFSDLERPFTAVSTDLIEGKQYNITHGDLSAAMVASSAITPLFKPQEIDGKLLVDGGVVDNLPVDTARAMGADLVIGVCVDTSLHPITRESMKSLRKLSGRVSDIYFYSKDEMSMAASDLTIYPNVDAVRLAERRKSKIQYAVHQGELAAEKAIPRIRALMESFRQQTAAIEQQPKL